jgi:hypothetical protein
MCRTDNKDPGLRKRHWVSLRAILFLIAPLCLPGCEHSPDYSILGSFFPVWIFCSSGGVLLMAGARVLILRTSIGKHLVAPVLFYFSMAVFFACALWLLFYS